MDRTFMKGSEAIAEAAIRAGCRFFAGYPITPQNEIPEYFSRRMPEVGGVFVQGESEVASINMVMGSSATGTRAMTSSSSCGISLKTEGISYIAQGKLPSVIVSVQRGGPGVGSIQPAQQDYFQATKAMGNGGFHTLVFAPATVQEAIDTMSMAFDKAEEYRFPVVVLIDGFTAVMMEPVALPPMKTDEEIAAIYAKNDEWSATGKKHPDDPLRHVLFGDAAKRGSLQTQNRTDEAMYETWAKKEVLVEEFMVEDAEIVIAAYGISARIAKAAVEELRDEGYKVGMIRPITVYPFPYETFEKLDMGGRVKGILDCELSIPAQMVEDVRLAVGRKANIKTCLRSGGEILSRAEIIEAARAMCENK